MRMMPRATQAPYALGRAALVSGVTRFVPRPRPAFRRLQYGTRLQNSTEPKYLAREESPIRGFYF